MRFFIISQSEPRFFIVSQFRITVVLRASRHQHVILYVLLRHHDHESFEKLVANCDSTMKHHLTHLNRPEGRFRSFFLSIPSYYNFASSHIYPKA